MRPQEDGAAVGSAGGADGRAAPVLATNTFTPSGLAISSHNKPGILSVKVTLGESRGKKEKMPAENERETALREHC